MAICPHKYGEVGIHRFVLKHTYTRVCVQLELYTRHTDEQAATGVIMVRDDQPQHPFTNHWHHARPTDRQRQRQTDRETDRDREI